MMIMKKVGRLFGQTEGHHEGSPGNQGFKPPVLADVNCLLGFKPPVWQTIPAFELCSVGMVDFDLREAVALVTKARTSPTAGPPPQPISPRTR